ncbi:Outer membrane efflux protein [Botrimarina hoheduenensis]|uniref:Outer membrane efflux protein n=2 Tax=Botrimarina hoheduenensis TaxID=2528000 RepID=A0A5C5VSX1_9BACT|nr:Outer membrane efflux protein [Botrimarina hoheduenensis]
MAALGIVAAAGCRSTSQPFVAREAPHSLTERVAQVGEIVSEPIAVEPVVFDDTATAESPIDSSIPAPPDAQLLAPQTSLTGPARERLATPQADNTSTAPSAELIVTSVRNHFPLVQQAIAGRVVASGQALSASGAFDHKLDAFSQSQPLDFYENYRHSVGIKRDTYWGGQTFAGYRVGRGDFEPWYLERETNRGGEFKAGFLAPLIRDRVIDANRAELWQAQWERTRVEAEIDMALIDSVREGLIAYWEWVAAGANLRVADAVLQLGLDRADFLSKEVKEGQKARIDLVDNQRIIVSRQAKQIDARRKVEQTAAKLSLFLRTQAGQPIVLSADALPADFPAIEKLDQSVAGPDIAYAQSRRPELAELRVIRRQLGIALSQANNETWADVDGGILVGQDAGEPTSSKRDKSEFELEATVTLSVPLERRKALGKIREIRGKMAQLNAKSRFATDKIGAEVAFSRAALIAAGERVGQTTEGLRLAEQMLSAERVLYEEGQSTLFNLNIREQQAAEAAAERVSAQLDYYVALAGYGASLGFATTLNTALVASLPAEDAGDDRVEERIEPAGQLVAPGQ